MESVLLKEPEEGEVVGPDLEALEDGTFTSDDVITKFGKFQLILFLVTGYAQAADAMEMMLLSFLGVRVHLSTDLFLTNFLCSQISVVSGVYLQMKKVGLRPAISFKLTGAFN